MSFSKKDRKVQAGTGRNFPVDLIDEVRATLAAVIAEALRRDFGDTPAQQKQIARLMGVNHRTVKNWLQSQNGPNGTGLIVLMRHSDAVTAAVLDLAGRHEERRRAKGDGLRRELRALLMKLLEHLGPE